MPQPVPKSITSTPAVPGMPYDPTDKSDLGGWRSLDGNAGPADINDGHVVGSFTSDSDWRQV